MRDDTWMRRAACQGMDTERWFPVGNGKPDDLAVATCRRCPVSLDCLLYSFGEPGDQAEYGVWGAMTKDQRQRERRNWQRREGRTG